VQWIAGAWLFLCAALRWSYGYFARLVLSWPGGDARLSTHWFWLRLFRHD